MVGVGAGAGVGVLLCREAEAEAGAEVACRIGAGGINKENIVPELGLVP